MNYNFSPKTQQRIYSIAILLLIISLSLILSSCNNRSTTGKVFDELIKGNVSDDLTLTIYYCDPDVLYYTGMSIEDITSDGFDGKIVVKSNELKEHSDVFKLLNNNARRCDKELHYEDVRVFFILKSKKCGTILQGVDAAYNGYYVPGYNKITIDFFDEVVKTFLIPNIEDENMRKKFVVYIYGY